MKASKVVVVFALVAVAGAGAGVAGATYDDACDSVDGWRRGKATYYAANEGGGDMGSHDNRLIRGLSVAVKEAWADRVGNWVCIRGLQTASNGSELRRVDDLCAGGGCREFDVYQGHEMIGDEGVDTIEYAWL